MITRWPAASNILERWPPTKPVPPVMPIVIIIRKQNGYLLQQTTTTKVHGTACVKIVKKCGGPAQYAKRAGVYFLNPRLNATNSTQDFFPSTTSCCPAPPVAGALSCILQFTGRIAQRFAAVPRQSKDGFTPAPTAGYRSHPARSSAATLIQTR